MQRNEAPASQRRKKPARNVCDMALTQLHLSALENFPKTQ